eukprot:12424827-Karenia_brevis.AAC.1
MRIKEWPNPSSVPVLDIHVDQQCLANKQDEASAPQEGWLGDIAVAPRPQPAADVPDPTHLGRSTPIMPLQE